MLDIEREGDSVLLRRFPAGEVVERYMMLKSAWRQRGWVSDPRWRVCIRLTSGGLGSFWCRLERYARDRTDSLVVNVVCFYVFDDGIKSWRSEVGFSASW